jgi:hypothetical protein
MSFQESHHEWGRLPLKRRKSAASLAATSKPPPVNFEALFMQQEQLDRISNKKIRAFYEVVFALLSYFFFITYDSFSLKKKKHQNSIIERYQRVDRVIDELQRDDEYESITPNRADEESAPLIVKQHETRASSPQWLIHLAINLSFVINIILFLTKLFLAVFSGSMAILASAFESFLDILSNAIIFFTIRVIQQKNIYNYPVGKVIFFSRKKKEKVSTYMLKDKEGQISLVWNHSVLSCLQLSSPLHFHKC